MPRVTVLMPVYNVAPYIIQAVCSVLEQTYADFELLIVDDGSTDGTREILRGFSDSRIRLVCNPVNRGLVYSLNEGLRCAQGELIARMDGDDICVSDRLAKQVAYLDDNPDVGLCGGQLRFMDNGHLAHKPYTYEEIKCWLLMHNCIAHPTVMMRKAILDTHGICYDPMHELAEDYSLWCRLIRVTKAANLPEVLVHYRRHPTQVSRSYTLRQDHNADLVRMSQVRLLGIEPTMEEYSTHLAFALYCIQVHDHEKYARAVAWANKLMDANRIVQFYDPVVLNIVLSKFFLYSRYAYTAQ